MRKYLLLLLTGLLLATGCHRIPLHERASGVYLKLNFHQEIDPAMAALLDFDARPELKDKVLGKTPELVRACFYDAVSHELVAEDFVPAEGDFIDVPAGAYDVVVYGLGMEMTQVTGTETRAGGFSFTGPTGVKVKMGAPTKADEETQEQSVVFEPDHLFVGKIAGANVAMRPAEASETAVLTAEMERISESWILKVIDIEGAERIQKADIYITGQAAGRYLWDARTSNHPCALSFEGTVDAAAGQLFAVFNTFGRYPEPETDVIVNVLVTTTGGNRCRFVYDVTDQWLNPDNSAHLILIDELMALPGDDFDGGGFEPVINDWDDEVIDIIVG